MTSLFRDFKAKVRALNRARLAKRRVQLVVQDITVSPYEQWVAAYDTLDAATTQALQQRVVQLRKTPVIAVVMPVYNANLTWLEQAIASVRAQLYPHWQLCIADDASTDPAIRPYLEQLVASDPRIKVAFREENGHISACSNSALALVDAPYFGLLDHDDVLREHALLLVAEALEHWPQALVVYSDEDKLSPEGQRCDPYFKPDWNPELLLGQNYLCHFTLLSTKLAQDCGGFRLGFEGSQDHDLYLRCTRSLAAERVVHIPHILYHWRQHSGSTAMANSQAKPYADEARRRAVQEHLDASGVAARAEINPQGWCRIQWQKLDPQPLVSIIIPTRNGFSILKLCIDSILQKTTYENYEILLIDNGSDDPETLAYMTSLQSSSNIKVIRDDSPFNYSAINNRAAKMAAGEYLALVNNDIEVISPDWLHEMVALASRDGVGAVGARLLYGNKTLQHGGVVLGVGGVAGHSHKYAKEEDPGYMGRAMMLHAASAVTGACLVVKKSVFAQIGGLDGDALAVAFNDVDFCIKLLVAGYRNVWTPHAELFHHESVSRGSDETPDKRQRFQLEVAVMQERWGQGLKWDPMYNPNLTIDREDFGLAQPPRVNLAARWFDSHQKLPTAAQIKPTSNYRTTIDLANRNDSHTRIIEHVQSLGETALRILDVGCAGGDMGHAMHQFGHHVTGIEPQASAAACAFHQIDEVYHGSLENYLGSSADARFDVIVLADVLEHLANPEALLKKLVGRLAPSGAFVVSMPNITHASVIAMLLDGRWTYSRIGLLDETHLRFFDQAGMAAMLAKADLEISKLSTTTASVSDVNQVFEMNLTPEHMAMAETISTHQARHVVQFIATCRTSRQVRKSCTN